MSAHPIMTSAEFTKPWYIHMVESFDAEIRDKVRQLEAEIRYQERAIERAGTASARARARVRLQEARRRMDDYIEFYRLDGGE